MYILFDFLISVKLLQSLSQWEKLRTPTKSEPTWVLFGSTSRQSMHFPAKPLNLTQISDDATFEFLI